MVARGHQGVKWMEIVRIGEYMLLPPSFQNNGLLNLEHKCVFKLILIKRLFCSQCPPGSCRLCCQASCQGSSSTLFASSF